MLMQATRCFTARILCYGKRSVGGAVTLAISCEAFPQLHALVAVTTLACSGSLHGLGEIQQLCNLLQLHPPLACFF